MLSEPLYRRRLRPVPGPVVAQNFVARAKQRERAFKPFCRIDVAEALSVLITGEPEDAKFPVGAMLYARRLLAGIDCHDMGRKIGLSAWQVLALESGDSRLFRGPDSFARALRVYARKLDVSPITASAALATLAALGRTPNAKPASSQRPALLSPPPL